MSRHSSCLFSLVVFLWSILLLLTSSSAASDDYVGGTPHASVVVLTKDTFDKAIKEDPANPLWLLKFYAPWCGHCKKLAPILEEVAPLVKGKMAIGTIDCTKEKSLCNDFNVRGYPTLKFSRDGVVHDYPGTRKKQDIVAFATKMSSHPVTIVTSYEEALEEVVSTSEHGVAFVAYHPEAASKTKITTMAAAQSTDVDNMLQSTHLTQVFAQVARQEQAVASFAIVVPEKDDALSEFGVDDDASKKGFIVKMEANIPPKIFDFTENDDFTASDLSAFVKEQNVPVVSELGPHNFHRIGKNGRRLVIGVVDGSDQIQINNVKKDLANFATTGPDDVVSQFYFGWMDGKAWQRFLEQFNVESDQLPQLLVLDVPARAYWQDASYKTTKDFVSAVVDGTIESKISEGPKKGILGKIQNAFLKNLPWSLFAVLIVVLSFVLFIIPKPEEMRPPYETKKEIKKPPAAAAAAAQETTPATTAEKKKDQ